MDCGNPRPVEFHIQFLIKNINHIARIKNRVGVKADQRTIIYPGNIFDLLLLTNLGDQREIIK